MKKGGTGGGNTITGLIYEGKVDLATFIAEQKNYAVEGNDVFYCGKCVAHVFKKHAFYDYLKTKGINWKEHISKQLLPDNAIYVIVNNTMFILEVKTQNVAGSVDEKLQTCDFKKKQYQKLLSQLNMEVQYIYILGYRIDYIKFYTPKMYLIISLALVVNIISIISHYKN